MKLIVQIPCYNEERTLADVVRAVPRHVVGIERVEILVVDDGSSDQTMAVARACGVDHVVRHTHNMGLARAFQTGLDACLALGADIIVNTDGDHQYHPGDIPRLIRPILEGTADIVVGDRRDEMAAHFSPAKRQLQALGSWVVKKLAGTHVPDAVSGFRAMSRGAALRLNIISSFSYTTEMVIQAGRKNLAVAAVPVRMNAPTRPSRLFRSTPQFIGRSLVTMVRTFAMYKPLRTFVFIGSVLFIAGALPILRFLYFWSVGQSQGHVQSLVLGGVLIVLGCVALLGGLMADLISFNRQLIEITLEKMRNLESNAHRAGSAPDGYHAPEDVAAAAPQGQTLTGPRSARRGF